MVKLGNFLFHYRNFIFPLFYLLLFIPSPLLFSNSLSTTVAGLIVATGGQLIRALTIGLVYIVRGGKDRRIYAEGLVTTGIFSHCRNPLYVGNILVIIGLGMVANSIYFLLIAIPLFIFFYQAIVRAEENFLQNKFGYAFTEYMQTVNRWLPNINGISHTLKSMNFNWHRVLVKEYNSTYIWMTGAVLLIIRNDYFQNEKESFMLRFPVYIIILSIVLACYLFIRYMKKSGKWWGD